MNIKYIKLVTGEDILANVEDGEPLSIILINPAKLVIVPQGLAMLPFVPTTPESEVVIRNEHIVCTHEVSPELEASYNAQFGNGLVVPQEKKLIGV
jgi:hypothetical protein